MKVVLSYARRLGASRRRRKAARKRSPVLAVPEKAEWHHSEHVSPTPLALEKAEEAGISDIKEVAPERHLRTETSPQVDPPLYTECVGEKQTYEEKTESPEVLVTDVEVSKTTEGRPRELLYRSQFNELQEKSRRPPEQFVRLRKVTRIVPDCTDYRAVYHKQALAEVWIELFNIVKVAVWAILAWLLVCGMIPPLK